MPTITRRDFLQLAVNTLLGAGGALALTGLVRYFGYKAEPPPAQKIDLGPVSNFPEGSITVLTSIPAEIRHDANGYFALSLKCTHLGCTVESKGSFFECPCHGSRFDPDGKRLRGPAARDLAILHAEPDDAGHLILSIG